MLIFVLITIARLFVKLHILDSTSRAKHSAYAQLMRELCWSSQFILTWKHDGILGK